MKVKYLRDDSGHGGSYTAGDEREVDGNFPLATMIAQGIVEKVEKKPPQVARTAEPKPKGKRR